MQLWACGCEQVYYQRMQRKGWMKLAGGRRLYRCLACDARMFIPISAAETAFLDTVAYVPEGRARAARRKPRPSAS